MHELNELNKEYRYVLDGYLATVFYKERNLFTLSILKEKVYWKVSKEIKELITNGELDIELFEKTLKYLGECLEVTFLSSKTKQQRALGFSWKGNKNKKLIFLGGSTDSRYGNWRKEYIEQLSTKYSLFNPVVSNWTEEHKVKEEEIKENSDILLFYICANNLYSIAELVDCSNKRPEDTVIIFNEKYIKQAGTLAWENVKTIGRLAENNGASVFYEIKESINYLKER